MRIFGFEITRKREAQSLAGLDRGWYPIIREPFTGAWQRGEGIRYDTMATYWAAYSCISMIAADIGKMRLRLMQQSADGLWSEVIAQSPYSQVFERPNRFQNRVKFIENWITSKLIHGATYALKERDQRGIVTDLYILDPLRTRPMVSPDGSIFYSMGVDNLVGVGEPLIAPASEIIHDVCVPLHHPLVGVSPLTACGLAAMQGLEIQRNSSRFFANGAMPSGIITTPGNINESDAKRIKEAWEEKFTGQNIGRVAVVGNGMKYEAMTISAADAQLIEQLKFTAAMVAACYHVPLFMLGMEAEPSRLSVETLGQMYLSQCLQTHIEGIEECLNDGLGLGDIQGRTYAARFDEDDLIRMDMPSKVKAATDAIGGALMAPNEARRRFNLRGLPGGDTIYMQEQNYSLEALAKRDAQDDPFAAGKARKESIAAPANTNDSPAPTPGGRSLLAGLTAAKQLNRKAANARNAGP